MKEVNEPQILLEQLRQQITKLSDFYESIDKQIYAKLKEKKETERMIDDVLQEGSELETILNKCSVDVCQYKSAFEDIRYRYSDQLEKRISKQDFHFFLCYRGDYYCRDGKGVIEMHKEIIDQYGFCWWGKFFKQRDKGGTYQQLEPFGESIRTGANSNVARKIKENVEKRISNDDHIFLYIYNPNPPIIKLYACNVIDFYCGDQKVPYQEKTDMIPPECSYIPDYYFHKRNGNCINCKGFDDKKCKLDFLCNYWFKIDRIKEIEHVNEEFGNLQNSFTKDSINFAIPILYPLLVFQNVKKTYFPELVKVISQDREYVLQIADFEKAHTDTEKVKKFFDILNYACHNSFVKVKSSICGRGFIDKPKLKKSEENDVIIIELPADYRLDQKSPQFKIYLDKAISSEQKKKVVSMIENSLK